MQNVLGGSIAKNERRKSAIIRLEKHLGDHKNYHANLEKDQFESHDKSQRKELEHMKEMTK